MASIGIAGRQHGSNPINPQNAGILQQKTGKVWRYPRHAPVIDI